jgi:cellulose synthase/poly-beta-1,6-N-acetylglucosamine synthase-like glycosyltransferase
MSIINIVLLILFVYLSVCVLYGFLFSFAGRMGRLKRYKLKEPSGKFAVFIPSYKEDEVILNSVKDALKQDYPKHLYDVIVIADSLHESTINILHSMPVKVIEVSFDVSTKAKSLNAALNQLDENQYDYALVLDADNIMKPDFLRKIHSVISVKGIGAVQGHRVAKNMNTNFAILDAVSEEINNHIYRRGHRVLGLSSGLIGSGMAFHYKYFKKVMATNKAIGGFDKELEHKLLRDRVKIEYVEDAYILDEKVESAEVFQNQRRRWISAQLHYFRQYFLQGLWHLITRGNMDFFDKAFQQFLAPRVLLLGITGVAAVLSIMMEYALGIMAYPGSFYWVSLFLIQTLSLTIAVPSEFFTKKYMKAMAQLPKAFLVMVLVLFKLKGANKKFIHTPHSGNSKL